MNSLPQNPHAHDAHDILPEDVPVEMPELPISLTITTAQQLKAFGDPVRSRILGIIQNQPATAKQIADRLGQAPGTIGHHLQVLEAAGLAQIVARRQIRGTVAKYYTRTARIFDFHLAKEVTGQDDLNVMILTHARDELIEAAASSGDETQFCAGFPHARISSERAREYERRVEALIYDLLSEPADPNGQVYGLCAAFFLSPMYLQKQPEHDA